MTHTVNIALAVPRNAAKLMMREIGCSQGQAERITRTGWIPGALRSAAIRFLKQEVMRRRAELDDVDAQIKALDYAAMVARVEAGQGRAVKAAKLAAATPGLDGTAPDEVGEEPLPLTGGAMRGAR